MKRTRLSLLAAVLASGLMVSGAASAATLDLTSLTLNGNASATANDLSLTTGPGNLSTAYLPTPFNTNGSFTLSFDATLTIAADNPQADGVAFFLAPTADGLHSIGLNDGGSGLAVSGITNAAGVGFQTFANNNEVIFQHGHIFEDLATEHFNLGSQSDVLHVTVNYNAGTLSYSATEDTTSKSWSDTADLDLSSDGLGPTAYLGFSGGSGGAGSIQDIKNVSLKVASVAAAPEPSTWALMLFGLGGVGALLRRGRRMAPSAAAA